MVRSVCVLLVIGIQRIVVFVGVGDISMSSKLYFYRRLSLHRMLIDLDIDDFDDLDVPNTPDRLFLQMIDREQYQT